MQDEIEKLAEIQAKSILEFYKLKEKNNFMLVLISMLMIFLLVLSSMFMYFYSINGHRCTDKQSNKYDIQYNIKDLIKLKERKSKYYEYKYYKQYTSYGVIYITIAKKI